MTALSNVPWDINIALQAALVRSPIVHNGVYHVRARALSCHALVASVARASQLIRRVNVPPSNRSHSHEHVRCRFRCCQRFNAMIEAAHRCQHDSAATAACARMRRVLRHTVPAAQHSVAQHRTVPSLRPVAHAHSAAQQHPAASSQRRRYPEVQRHDFLPALEREDVHTISHLISRCVAGRLDGFGRFGPPDAAHCQATCKCLASPADVVHSTPPAAAFDTSNRSLSPCAGWKTKWSLDVMLVVHQQLRFSGQRRTMRCLLRWRSLQPGARSSVRSKHYSKDFHASAAVKRLPTHSTTTTSACTKCSCGRASHSWHWITVPSCRLAGVI